MNYEPKLAEGMVEEILKVIYKYEESVCLALALGALKIVEYQLIQDHQDNEEEEW